MCKKVNSKEELLALYDNVKDLLELRTKVNENPEKYHISVCGGTGCSSSNSLKIVEALKHWAKEYKVEDKVEISITGCFGFCERGPIVKIFPDHVFYTKVNEEEARLLENVEYYYKNFFESDENLKFRLWQRQDKRRAYLSASYIENKPYVDLINKQLCDKNKINKF